jgi:heme-degrading monooxygenase HmoA
MAYLRVTIAKWSIDVYSPEAEDIFHRIATEGVRVFRAQPGFIRYRLMRADPRTTIAVAEWESETLGKPGAQAYRDWMKESGVADKIVLETYDGDIVAAS